jgi:hypothetical protein
VELRPVFRYKCLAPAYIAAAAEFLAEVWLISLGMTTLQQFHLLLELNPQISPSLRFRLGLSYETDGLQEE